MEFGVDLDQTATKSSCDVKWHGISMRIHVTFFAGFVSCFVYKKHLIRCYCILNKVEVE